MESISLLIVLTAALLTPLLMAHFHINSIPTAVAEILVGIILGKSLLGWVHTGGEMQALSELGVTILIDPLTKLTDGLARCCTGPFAGITGVKRRKRLGIQQPDHARH